MEDTAVLQIELLKLRHRVRILGAVIGLLKIGSSPESMGEKDRLRKLAWPMKQGSFERIEGTKAARCSDGEFGIGVQCLDDSG
ncbi:MAG: hypothetical protein SGI86_19160, partial [Deltaproteobacteria bacterium]|nr:hypothetical protein [Deltaproteobacteria bacterium]